MAVVRYTCLAEADLLRIAAYTLDRWGRMQADRYLSELEVCCARLAARPSQGRPCDEIRKGLRRTEHGKHVVFYRLLPNGILVCRVLHQRMLPGRHTIDNAS